uniref:Angiotensin-converting enzyme n=1 Tax=Timema shepardi TaxID=629360 RepID=A0A7R9ATG0_TIMSH|nr:unnamed protein product [Timema shepardi]
MRPNRRKSLVFTAPGHVTWRRLSVSRRRSLVVSTAFSGDATSQDATEKMSHVSHYTDASAQWLSLYESPEVQDIPKEVARLWNQLRPLYLQLHAYVRRKLYLKYGVSIVDQRRGIPAHLLGNMWGQSWDNLLNISQPFPDTPSPKVTEALKQQGFTSRKMFQVAEEFFVSLNLSAMPPLFWRNSILEKPAKRRRVNCHSSAWDFMDRKDFRILQCSDVSLRSFLTAHHEMGHIENFVLYKDQPPTYREGANPGFDEAIGDVITLSVMTPKHLKKIGLLSDDEHVESYEASINHLYSVALRKLTLLPFAYVIDLWRWAVFQGSVTPRNYNCHWWYLREKYQGVVPPEKRSEEQFDPGSKFHVAANVPYIRYFISAILEFQMHRHMCEVVGEYDPHDNRKPLHSCDIYQKQQAGTLLREVMSMGSSRPWPEALKVITGSRCMDASALREYLLPLEHWLTVENEKTGEFIGWEHTGTGHCRLGAPRFWPLSAGSAQVLAIVCWEHTGIGHCLLGAHRYWPLSAGSAQILAIVGWERTDTGHCRLGAHRYWPLSAGSAQVLAIVGWEQSAQVLAIVGCECTGTGHCRLGAHRYWPLSAGSAQVMAIVGWERTVVVYVPPAGQVLGKPSWDVTTYINLVSVPQERFRRESHILSQHSQTFTHLWITFPSSFLNLSPWLCSKVRHSRVSGRKFTVFWSQDGRLLTEGGAYIRDDSVTSGGSGMTVAFIIFAVATFLHLWESHCWQLLTAAWSALRPNESVSPSLRHLVHTVEVQMLDRLTGSKNCSHLVMNQDAIN